MNYKQTRESLIWNIRLDFDPVGIVFIEDESQIPDLPVTHEAKNKLTYCQFLAAVRQERYALFMPPKKLLCLNACAAFGFRELQQDIDTKRHLKYIDDPEIAWQIPCQKARLELNICKGIYMAPLDWFDSIGIDPSVVFIVSTPYQAYHLLNDYMGAMKRPNLSFFHNTNSAVCSGSVYSYNNKTANMTTMCAGSKTSGKTEMNYVNVFIPGDQILKTVEKQVQRCEKGGPSLIGKGNVPWPGLDVCTGCPLFKFTPVKK